MMEKWNSPCSFTGFCAYRLPSPTLSFYSEQGCIQKVKKSFDLRADFVVCTNSIKLKIFLINSKTESRWPFKVSSSKINQRESSFYLFYDFIRGNTIKKTRQHSNPHWNIILYYDFFALEYCPSMQWWI